MNMGPKGMNDAFAKIIVEHMNYKHKTMVISKAVNKLIQEN